MSSSNNPDVVAPPDSERVEKLNRIFDQAWVPRDVYGPSDLITVEWPEDLDELCDVSIIMQHESGRIYAQADKMIGQGTTSVTLRKGLNASDGRYHAVIRPKAIEYYNGTKIERALPFYLVNNKPSTAHYGDPESRRMEALQDAAQRGPDTFTELARLHIDEPLRGNILNVPPQPADTFSLLGQLFIVMHYGDKLPAELVAEMNGNLRQVEYGSLGRFGTSPTALASKMLAAKLYKSDDDSRQQTETWLRNCAAEGFEVTGIEETLIALAALVELADELSELAAVVFDKLLFTLALHPTRFSVDARLSPLSPVTRLLWGLGNSNDRYSALVMLACAESYEIPSLIQAIAIDSGDDLYAQDTLLDDASRLQRIIYRTPDYSLVSLGKSWFAELGHVHVRPHGYSSAIAHKENRLTHTSRSSRPANHDCVVYWPTYEFDDWSIQGKWAFGRIEEGYIALHSTSELSITNHGKYLSAFADEVTWFCCMGNAEMDGNFEDFVAKMLDYDDFSVEADHLPENRHYQSPFCEADFSQNHMDIRYKDYVMRLDFSGTAEE